MAPLLMAAVLFPVAMPWRAGASGADLVIEGRGWGHGVGLAQDGALAMGRAGADTSQILDHFYPGTTDASVGGRLRVVLPAGPGRQTTIRFPGGGELRAPGAGPQPPGFPVGIPPAATVTVSVDGNWTAVHQPSSQPQVRPSSARTEVVARLVRASYRTTAEPTEPSPASTSTTAPPTTRPRPTTPPATSPAVPSPPVVPPSPAPPAAPTPAAGKQELVIAGPVVAVPTPGGTTVLAERNRRFRGSIEIGGAGGSIRLVNDLDVEEYLRGMGEVRDPSWPAASLQAQAVAARTYALRAMADGGEICADDRCQVYLGADAEYPAMDDAVRASTSRVRRSGTELASTFYSANAGGVSATPEEGFGPGGSDLPYLRSAPYQTADPDPWTLRLSLDDAGRKLRYPGRLERATVSRAGPSGRALEVSLDGDGGTVTLTGTDFAARLRLRSTLVALSEGGSAVAVGAMAPPAHPGDVEPGSQAGAAAARIGDAGGGGVGATAAVVVALGLAAGLVVRRSRELRTSREPAECDVTQDKDDDYRSGHPAW